MMPYSIPAPTAAKKAAGTAYAVAAKASFSPPCEQGGRWPPLLSYGVWGAMEPKTNVRLD